MAFRRCSSLVGAGPSRLSTYRGRSGRERSASACARPSSHLGAAAAVAIVAGQDPKAGAFVPLVVAIAVLHRRHVPAVDRMAGSAWGRQVLYVWAGLDLLLITLAAWSAAGVDAALPLGYGVTIVFFAVVFPIRGQAAFLAAMLACYTGVLLSTEFEFLPLAMLATLGAPRVLPLPRGSTADRRRRSGSASRPSGGGRSPRWWRRPCATVRTPIPRPCCKGSKAVVSTGIRGGGDPRRGRRAVGRAPGRHRRGARRAAAIRSGIGPDRRPRRGQGGRRRGRRRRATDHAHPPRGGTPGDAPPRRSSSATARSAILLVASDEPDPVTPPELDAFAMLAAPAGLALVNAARAVDERTATEVRRRRTGGGCRADQARARHAAVR